MSVDVLYFKEWTFVKDYDWGYVRSLVTINGIREYSKIKPPLKLEEKSICGVFRSRDAGGGQATEQQVASSLPTQVYITDLLASMLKRLKEVSYH